VKCQRNLNDIDFFDIQRQHAVLASNNTMSNNVKGEEHDEEIISLNVGGQVFVTTTTTLRNDTKSMLYAMFSGKYQKKDFKGSYFIDRDGKYFRCIYYSLS
jgi:BTB/POZ domain